MGIVNAVVMGNARKTAITNMGLDVNKFHSKQ